MEKGNDEVNKKFKNLVEEYPELWEEKTYKKGEVFITSGQIVEKIFFIKTGKARVYFYNEMNAKEATVGFFNSHEAFIPYGSFVENVPAQMNVQVISKAVMYSITKEDWNKMKAYDPEIDNLITRLAIRHLFGALDYIAKSIQYDSTERYLLTIERFSFLRNFPDETISLYLGIDKRTVQRARANYRVDD